MNSRAAGIHLLADQTAGLPVWHAAAAVAGRLAMQLRADGGGDADADADAGAGAGAEPTGSMRGVLQFLDAQAAQAAALPAAEPQPLDDLARALNLCPDERLLLLLAGMADEHEGYAAAFAAIHPRGESRPTWGLFARLVASDAGRTVAWQLLQASRLLQLGIVQLVGNGPLPERSLQLAAGVWRALHGLPGWPAGAQPLPASPWLLDFDDWDCQPDTQTALALLLADAADAPAAATAVLLRSPQPAALRLRAQQLAAVAGGLVFDWDAASDAPQLSSLLAHCVLRHAVPVLLTQAPLPPTHWALLNAWPLPLVLAGAAASQAAHSTHALWPLDAPLPTPAAQARLWQRALPQLREHADVLSARYPVGPQALLHLQRDLAVSAAGCDAPALASANAPGSTSTSTSTPTLAHCVAALKARMADRDGSVARRVLPVATWDDLVLAPDKLAILHAAVARMQLQRRVLDDWGFGQRAGGVGTHNRGLRLLFSGLPGTGKTLAAEVMAQALHADLLVIDLARLVSKWVGETEKNLASAFEQAEDSGAVLFFDEADALFGKRSDGGDAHDRYANIESAYLLARLERFDGIAILATNLRGNLDRAFLRRFEVALDFCEPGPAERAAIWRRQFPPQAPLAADVDMAALAAQHALSGALIRSAALGAAFIAAASGATGGPTPIERRHIERALRQEYEKSGRACPL